MAHYHLSTPFNVEDNLLQMLTPLLELHPPANLDMTTQCAFTQTFLRQRRQALCSNSFVDLDYLTRDYTPAHAHAQLRQLVSLVPSLLVARGPAGRVEDSAQPFRPDFRAKVWAMGLGRFTCQLNVCSYLIHAGPQALHPLAAY